MSNPELTKKIKEGIQKSGFPLELKIGSILKRNDWIFSIGNIYRDFETGKYRESDISAEKNINGISVHLMIECKKSTEKQIVLYSPQANKPLLFASLWFKQFPKLVKTKEGFRIEQRVFEEFKKLKVFDSKIPLAKNLIVTRGDKVTEDNVQYYSSINGLIKKSIHSGSDGYIETGYRSVFFYILVFEGSLYQLTSSATQDFDLTPIDYGQVEYELNLQFAAPVEDDIIQTASAFGSSYNIEIMTPSYFESYLQELESSIRSMFESNLTEWGEPWPKVEL